jgi:hypothetical protein
MSTRCITPARIRFFTHQEPVAESGGSPDDLLVMSQPSLVPAPSPHQEHAVRFELTMTGFADRRLNHLGYACDDLKLRAGIEPAHPPWRGDVIPLDERSDPSAGMLLRAFAMRILRAKPPRTAKFAKHYVLACRTSAGRPNYKRPRAFSIHHHLSSILWRRVRDSNSHRPKPAGFRDRCTASYANPPRSKSRRSRTSINGFGDRRVSSYTMLP